MRADLTRDLYDRFPGLYAQRSLPMSKTAMCWGFDVGDGWHPLVDALSQVLTTHANDVGKPVIQAVQVKEKFGTLCFYANGQDDFEAGAIHAADIFSGRLCEKTGKPGRIGVRGGWYSVRCPEAAEAEGITILPPEKTKEPALDLPAIRAGLAERHAGVLHGAVNVPVGWADLVDVLLEVLAPQSKPSKGEPIPAQVLFLMRDNGQLVVGVENASDRMKGAVAFAAALAAKLDPETGSAFVPEASA